MKNVTKHFMISLIFVAITACSESASTPKEFGICTTQNDTLNMMVASQVYGNKLMVTYRDKNRIYEKAYDAYRKQKLKDSKVLEEIQRLNDIRNKASAVWSNYVSELTKLGQTTYEGKFQEACDAYIAISQKYGGNIKEDYKSTIRIDAPQKKHDTNLESCGLGEASVVYMVFIEEAAKHQSLKTKEVEGLIESAGLDVIRKPNEVCKKVALASEKMNISYQRILHTAQGIIAKNKEKMQQREAISKKNAKLNKICSQKDIVTLTYKERDLSKLFLKLEEAWGKRASDARYAKLQNSKLIALLRTKKKEISDTNHALNKAFDKRVENDAAALGKYDLACENYKQLEQKYKKVLSQLQKEFDTFDTKKSLKSAKPNNSYNNSNSENQKYNYFVQLINKVTPQMRDAFQSYARECGSNKNKRVHERVEEAVRTFGAQNRALYEKSYGYHITRTFTQNDIQKITALCDAILANKSYPQANEIIEQYKTSVNKYMPLYSEAAEYYNMKDYMDDKFQKADALHKPIVEAYEQILAMDQALRKIVNEISDIQSLAQIEMYKKSNQMVFYHVAKAQFLSKKFFEYANHKQDYMQLDPKKLRVKVDELRDFYKQFQAYALDNKSIFDDNTQYRYYLKSFHEYLLISKEFYVRVKSKKRHDMDEEVLMHIPKSARALMEDSMEGTLSKLLKHYNVLVGNYNSLNM